MDILGPSLSGNTLAVVKVMNDAKVPLVSCAASNKIVTPVVDRKWIFKVPQSDTHAVEKIYDYLLKNGIKKIAIMSVSTGFGASGREELLRLRPTHPYSRHRRSGHCQLVRGTNPGSGREELA
jgi:branched-chain amino acid transport system substrate-binding protein